MSDKFTISNAFNNYFVEIGPQLERSINTTVNPLTYVRSSSNSMFMPYVEEHEIIEIVYQLKESSPGWDSIPASVAKTTIQSYTKPLTSLINSSFENGLFPDELKLTKVIPIFKNGDKTDITNYRPISVLSFFSNIIGYTYQFGFRKSHSTSHAIISLVEKINNALDSGKILIGVFLDLKKAFDTVNHKILLDKLFIYGIRGNILKWFKSYLNERQQYVNFQGTESQMKCVTCGVPQGSIIGPLLFILYINDMDNVSKNIFPILFADDTMVLIEGNNLDVIITSLNSELDRINTWLKSNKLSLNVTKTHYMVFHRARRKVSHNKLFINNSMVTQVSCSKLLGIILDNKLNWTSHIAYIKKQNC